MKDYTDEDILEQFRFSYQIMYAVGRRNLGELYLAERTWYEFRRRVYRYTVLKAGEKNQSTKPKPYIAPGAVKYKNASRRYSPYGDRTDIHHLKQLRTYVN